MKKIQNAITIVLFVVLCTMLCACTPSPYDIVAESLRNNGTESSSGKYTWVLDEYSKMCVNGNSSDISVVVHVNKSHMTLWLHTDGAINWYLYDSTTGTGYNIAGEIDPKLVTQSSIDHAFSERIDLRDDNIPTIYISSLKDVAKDCCGLAITVFAQYLHTYTDLTMADFGFVIY